MAQVNKKTNNKPVNTSLVNVNTASAKQAWKKYGGIIIVIVGIVAAIGWYFSDFWPWPSKERVQDRMDTVLEACNGNEDSKKCKDLQQRYNMTFKYCSNLTDFWTLQKKYPDMADQFKHIGELNYYGVVWEGKSEEPPERTYEVNGQTMTSPSTYYSCSDHLK